jgi:hypothetical protein
MLQCLLPDISCPNRTKAIIRVNKQGKVVHLEGKRIVLQQPKDIFRRLRSAFNSPTSLVDELIEERCTEAKNE